MMGSQSLNFTLFAVHSLKKCSASGILIYYYKAKLSEDLSFPFQVQLPTFIILRVYLYDGSIFLIFDKISQFLPIQDSTFFSNYVKCHSGRLCHRHILQKFKTRHFNIFWSLQICIFKYEQFGWLKEHKPTFQDAGDKLSIWRTLHKYYEVYRRLARHSPRAEAKIMQHHAMES